MAKGKKPVLAWGVFVKGSTGECVNSDDKTTGVVVGYPLFERRKDAEEFMAGNKEWEVRRVEIKL